jgi:Tfp pilus assembly protein PilX
MTRTKLLKNTRGVAIFVVFITIIMVIIFANVMLTMMLSHARLTQHQLGRIQAYYAALAGINYAFDRIRAGDVNWIPESQTPPATEVIRTICNGCTAPNINEPDLGPNNPLSSVQEVRITIGQLGSGLTPESRRIVVTTTYITREAPTTP